jgi:branched-chain amino acid transport system substrate-binding protein
MRPTIPGAAALAALLALVAPALNTPARAEPPASLTPASLTIGFIATMTGAGGVTGAKPRDGLQLAIDQAGGRLGGLPTRLIVEDDQDKPDIARQIVEKFMLSDKVDVIVAGGFSNILLAIAGPVTRARTLLISANGGPSLLAGKGCSPWFFNTSWQSDTYAEAAGAYLQSKGVQNIYMLAPNYTAGRDVMTGFRRTYHGKIVGEKLTEMKQLDFSAELAEVRAAHPGALFAFYPGGLGIQFIKQFAQSGLGQTVPLYTAHTIDNTTLRAVGQAAIGQLFTTFWGADLDNQANRRFVAAWRARYGDDPSEYSAQAYDAGLLLDSAIHALGGNIANREALREAIERADFASVRGTFRFANDHFPIQNYYLARVEADATGKPTLRLGELVLRNYANAYVDDCKMD